MASVGFDNRESRSRSRRERRGGSLLAMSIVIRIYDRGSDPLKMIATPPKLVHTLKGKNRNWPIKSAWFQGRNCESTGDLCETQES